MKKLLATDLDGTLIINNEISIKNIESVKSLRERENVFVVSTGRPLNGVGYLEEEYDIEIDYYILLNGALILDGDKKVVKHEFMKKNIVKEILDTYKTKDMKISLESGYCTYLLDKSTHLPYPNNRFIESMEKVEENISLISIFMPTYDILKIDEIKDSINKNYKGTLVAYRNSSYIDIVPKGCSKGAGVEFIANKELLKNKNTYTIGDSWNDVSMFKVSKNSFTFNYVEDKLKKEANHLVDSVSECIENYVLV